VVAGASALQRLWLQLGRSAEHVVQIAVKLDYEKIVHCIIIAFAALQTFGQNCDQWQF